MITKFFDVKASLWATLLTVFAAYSPLACTSASESDDSLNSEDNDTAAEVIYDEDESANDSMMLGDGLTDEAQPMLSDEAQPGEAEKEPLSTDDSDAEGEGDASETTSPQSFDQTYTVVAGDWLSKLAIKFYGDVNKWTAIQKANPQIQNPDLIFPGDVIKIPAL